MPALVFDVECIGGPCDRRRMTVDIRYKHYVPTQDDTLQPIAPGEDPPLDGAYTNYGFCLMWTGTEDTDE